MQLSFAQQPGASGESGELRGFAGSHGFADWAEWSRSQSPPAQFLSVWSGFEVHGFDSPTRLGGVASQPAAIVLGLRGWDDAVEGVIEGPTAEIPFVLFDIEKIVRMLLHQSGLAFEILASPVVLYRDKSPAAAFPARQLIEAALSSDILHHYRDIASGWMARLAAVKGKGVRSQEALGLVRNALTGAALTRGEVEFRLPKLLENCEVPGLSALLDDVAGEEPVSPEWMAELQASTADLIASIRPEKSVLPARPSDYDWLNDFVVDLRRRVDLSKQEVAT